MSSFRNELLAAAESAVNDGRITRGEVIGLRIKTRLFPKLVQQLELAAAEQVAADRGIPFEAVGAIDWAGLAAFLKEILPILLQILPLFFDKAD